MVNILASFIREREARHDFRNKYSRKSNFRKLRDDNKRLFNENKILVERINKLQGDFDKLKNKRMFKITNAKIISNKKFFDDPNLTEKYQKLINGLDDESLQCVSQILGRRMLISQQRLSDNENEIRWLDIFSDDEIQQLNKIGKDFKQKIVSLADGCFAYKQHLLPVKQFRTNVFYYKHDLLKLKHLDRIKNKDVIDAGGCIADSAIMFTEYINGRIYTFEPTTENYELMIKTISINNSKNIVPVKLALGSKDEVMQIKVFGGASTLKQDAAAYHMTEKVEEVSVTTLDNFVKEKDLDIGLIKVDVEGFEPEFLKGAYNTIKKFKPAMLISIYHSKSDFFNIKPMIESWGLGYSFQVSRPVDGDISVETMLICEQDS